MRLVDGAPTCAIELSNTTLGKNGLLYRNRDRSSQRIPLSEEPMWTRFRFPVPPGHEAVSLDYGFAQARLFGSHPTTCHALERDDSGACVRTGLADDHTWTEEVAAGVFFLWGRADGCSEWVVTGPHEPIRDFTFNSTERYIVDVPAALRHTSELVVAPVVYHQYPGGCDGSLCYDGRGQYASLRVDHMQLRTEAQRIIAVVADDKRPTWRQAATRIEGNHIARQQLSRLSIGLVDHRDSQATAMSPHDGASRQRGTHRRQGRIAAIKVDFVTSARRQFINQLDRRKLFRQQLRQYRITP